jgi:signal transduction histidine kinase
MEKFSQTEAKSTRLIFILTTVFIALGSFFDGLAYWDVFKYQLANLSLFLTSTTMFLLYYNGIIKIKYANMVTVYATMANIYFVFITNNLHQEFLPQLLRNSIIIPALILSIGITSGKAHVIVSSAIYYIVVVLLAFLSGNTFLQHNLIFFLLVLSGTSAAIYIVIKQLDEYKNSKHHHRFLLQEYIDQLIEEKKHLLENNQLKEKVIKTLTGELKNDVQAIRTAVDFLFDHHEIVSKEVEEKYRAHLHSAIHKAENITDSFYLWSNAINSSDLLKKIEVPLNTIVLESFDTIKDYADKKGIKLQTSGTNLKVTVNKETFSIALTNLLHNAVKYSSANSTVDLKAKYKNNKTIIEVIDRGTGIESNGASIIENGHIPIKKGTQNETGLGLGLKICNDFILLNNGIVEANSIEGKGSVFKITLSEN